MLSAQKKGFSMKHVGIIAAAAACILIFLFFPQKSVISRYMMKVTNEGFIYFIAVLGLCVMLGMGGQVTFSTAGLMGVGAYTTAITPRVMDGRRFPRSASQSSEAVFSRL